MPPAAKHPGSGQINLWLPNEDRDIICRAAALAERKVSDYARRTLAREARKELQLAGEKIVRRRASP
jgi:uncharacterized protein (DUF1778 family)